MLQSTRDAVTRDCENMSVLGDIPFAPNRILSIKEEVEIGETQLQEQIFDVVQSRKPQTRSKIIKGLCQNTENNQTGLNVEETNQEQPYKCNLCPKDYASSQGLRLHLKKHKGIKRNYEKEHNCPMCPKAFKTMQSLHYHMNNHNEARPFECSQCPRAFNNPSSLWNHVERYHSKQIFPCRICSKEFLSHSNRWEHERTVHDTEKRFKCSRCNNKSFASIKLLNRHITRIHDGIKTPQKKNHVCSICAKAYRSKSKLEGHMNAHAGSQPFVCRLCPKKFADSECLRRHKFTHDSQRAEAKTRPRFKCTLCEKSYNSKIRLSSHMNVHRGERPFKCEVCPKTFTSKELLSSHNKTHLGHLEFECTLCNKKFAFNSDRRKHEKTHLNDRMNYKCENCEKYFNLQNQYRSHLEDNKCKGNSQKSESRTVLGMENSFHCPKCDNESFVSIELLNRHTLQIHSRREQNHTCSVCAKSFRSSYRLHLHMNSHTGNTPYACTVCPKKYGRPDSLRKHKLIHNSLSEDLKPRFRFKCTLCEKSYNSRIRLNIHMHFHLGAHSFNCKICPKSFRSKAGLCSHKKTHVDGKKYACKLCNKKFAYNCSRRRHEKTHSDEPMDYQCGICKHYFKLEDQYRSHVEGNQCKGHASEKPFDSSKSDNESCASIELLNQHKVKIHSQHHLLHACTMCPKKYRCLETLSKHKLSHSFLMTDWKIRPSLKCMLCEKSYNSRTRLNDHTSVHRGERPYKCKHCSKSFTSKGGLGSHSKAHTDDGKYECTLCDKKFTYNSNRRRHEKTHLNNSMKFRCDKCENYFQLEDQFRSHLEYKCERNSNELQGVREKETCQKQMQIQDEVENIETDDKDERKEDPFEKKYKCEECSKEFICKRNLNFHIRSRNHVSST